MVHERDLLLCNNVPYRIEVARWGPVLMSKIGLRGRYVLCKKVVSAIEPSVLDDNLHRVEARREPIRLRKQGSENKCGI